MTEGVLVVLILVAASAVLAVQIIPELESDVEPEPVHDSSTNALIRHYRRLKH